jgi:hypothetical protein
MDMEARSLPPEQAKSLQVNVRNYKADLASLKDQLRKAAAAVPAGDAARAELVRSTGSFQQLLLPTAWHDATPQA